MNLKKYLVLIFCLIWLHGHPKPKHLKISHKNFKIVFMVCSDGQTDLMLDTFNEFYWNSNCDSSVAIKLKLSNRELNKIYQKLDSMKFGLYPSSFEPTEKPEIIAKRDSANLVRWYKDSVKQSVSHPGRPFIKTSTSASVTPCWSYFLTIELNGIKKSVRWNDCSFIRPEQMSMETKSLFQVGGLVSDVVHGKSRIKKVKWQKCGYL